MKLLVLALMGLMGAQAFAAGELDSEKLVTNVSERAKELPATLVMRVNEQTKVVEVAHLTEEISGAPLSDVQATKMVFTNVAAEQKYTQKQFSELDSDNSRESWYFYYSPYGYSYGYGYGYNYYGYNYGYAYPAYSYYYPTYNYYGSYYAYAPYYNYAYAGYSYYYYRPCGW